MKIYIYVILLVLFQLVITGCTSIGNDKQSIDSIAEDHGRYDESKAERASEKSVQKSNRAIDHTKTTWGYGDEIGPENWGDLSPDFHLCKKGSRQSPVDITETQQVKLGKIQFKYNSRPYNIVNSGHTVQVNMLNGSSIKLDGKLYWLKQFHFHTPSEHLIDGKPADMAVHFVHKARDGKIAVVAVLMDGCFENKTIRQLWKKIPRKPGSKKKISKKSAKWINVKSLIPSNRAYYQYMGSLTTPPCTEEVTWIVMRNSTPVSRDQLKVFSDLFGNNARPVQNKNYRVIRTSK
ncbi:MAG: carbonic anhydrase family protein [Gammaproteobacteria bacterium]|nr:carbonic anhydrase family protein [Gammaproteobacteria bacterium]